MNKSNAAKQIVEVAHVAFIKRLTAGWGGNISIRLADDRILITPHKGSLGFIHENDLLELTLDGELLTDTEARVSTETEMHLALYRSHNVKAVIHLHPPCVNSLIAAASPLKLSTYESSLTLGGMPPVLKQNGPTVTDTTSLVQAFETSNIAILEKHGIVAAGDDLIEAFSLADVLEEAARTTINASILSRKEQTTESAKLTESELTVFNVFSQEHLEKIQSLINNDEEAQKLGLDTNLTVKYAIKQLDDGKIYNMHFVKGKLAKITNDEDADFINVGKKEIWVHIFNGRLDPFAATSQKKLRLIKGHIGDLSKWYAPFYRIFDLWKYAPVKELDNA